MSERAPSDELRDRVRDFTILDPSLIDEPDTLFAQMRTSCPVAYSDKNGGFFAFTRHEDVAFAYDNPELFSNAVTILDSSMGQERPLIPLQVDPPAHAGYRRLLLPLFSRPRVLAAESMIREVVNNLIDGFAGRGECEFVGEFAYLLPTHAFVRFVGWPPEDTMKFHEWAYKAIAGHEGELTEEESKRLDEERKASAAAMYDYFAALVDERRRHPADDLISELLVARYEDRALTDQEILDICFLLVLAGFDTTRKILSAALTYLAEHPDQRDAIVRDLAIVPTAAEELLRMEARLAVVRTLTDDLDRGGVHLPVGSRVLVLTGSAGRDAEVFENADEVDLRRRKNNHFAFGAGIHRCIGIHFARLEIQVALEELHKRLPDYHLTPGRAAVRTGGYGPGVASLPLTFTPTQPLAPDEENL